MRKARILSLALVGAAAALVAAPGSEARSRYARSSFVRSDVAADATGGRLRVREGRAGRESVSLRLRGLEPLSRYRVKDRDAGTTLGSVTTNPAGGGSWRTRDRDPGYRFAGLALQVVDDGTGDVVLEGRVPDAGHAGVREARAVFEAAGLRAVLGLRSDPRRGSERMRLEVAGLQADGSFSLFLDDGTGALVEVGALLCGDDADHDDGDDNDGDDGQEADDGDGTDGGDRAAALNGRRMKSHPEQDGDDDASGGDGDDEAGDDDGGNENGGNDGEDDDGDDDGDDDDGGNDDADDENEADGEDDDADEDGSECGWEVDTRDGDALPFGALTVEELVGRRFEIRDAQGSTLLDGEVPGLPEEDDREEEGGHEGDEGGDDDGDDDANGDEDGGDDSGDDADGDGEDHEDEGGDEDSGEGDGENHDEGNGGDGEGDEAPA